MSSAIVLIPTYNEVLNLAEIVRRLAGVSEADVLVIDDASPDGTGELADTLSKRFRRLSVVHRRQKLGLGPAYVHGLKLALSRGYQRVITMDADLSHSPEDVPRLLAALDAADVAIGSRHVPGGGVLDWPVSRRLLSRAGSFYARTLLALPVRDVTSGFRAYRRSALEELALDEMSSKGFIFQVEILAKILDEAGRRAVEVPILFRNRTQGVSKIDGSIVCEAAKQVWNIRWRPRNKAPRRATIQSRSRWPFVSVIVPRRREQGAACDALSGLDYPEESYEVLVARGSCPAKQRNEAIRKARGKYLYFIDDDSRTARTQLESAVQELEESPEVAAIGGPAVLEIPEGSSAISVISDPCVSLSSSSRYAPRGVLRSTDERELILCNLLVTRSIFEEVGFFDERLYPNEENEWLERVSGAGWQILYDPEFQVERPAWPGIGNYLRSIFRYGRGRATQFRLSPRGVSLMRVALIAVLLTACASLASLGMQLFAFLSCGAGSFYFALLLVRRGFRNAVAGCMTPAVYVSGVACGLCLPLRQVDGDVEIERISRKEEIQA